jgi:glycosyltransferase involved in cell wall biosynthesis
MKKADADVYMLKTASSGVPLVAFFCWLHRRAFAYRTASDHECNGQYMKKHPVLGLAFKLSLRMARIVFTQNINDKENLQRTTGISSVFIRNGHYLDTLGKTNRDIILWVARSGSEKGPELLIDLAEQMPREKFVMICPHALGDEKYEQMVSRAQSVENLEFLQQVPFHQIDKFFQRAKVFVCTSQREGFPNTYIQACKCATPILSLNINPDDFLNKYSCGLCCGGDKQHLADTLKFMLAENRYVQMGRNGRKYAEEHHDIKKIVEQYKAIFLQSARYIS